MTVVQHVKLIENKTKLQIFLLVELMRASDDVVMFRKYCFSGHANTSVKVSSILTLHYINILVNLTHLKSYNMQ